MDFSIDSFSDINSQLSKQQRKLVKKLPNSFSRAYVDKTTKDNSLIEKIVAVIPQQASKLLPDFKGLTPKKEKSTINYLLDFDWLNTARKLGYLANLYGAAYLLLDIDDGRAMDMPVDYSVRPQITKTYTIIQEYCYADAQKFDTWTFDDVEYYSIQRNGECETVHSSRLLCFYGNKQYGQSLCDQGFYHRPLWFQAFPALVHYDMSLQATVDMLKDADIFIYKMNGLHDLLAGAKKLDCDGDGKVTKQLVNRLRALVDCRSLTGSMIFDQENEEAEYINRDYANVDQMVKTLRQAFAERTNLPQSVLFSSSDSALFSDAGEGDRYSLAATVNSYQREQHTENIRKLLRIFDFRIRSYSIEYPSTVEQTASESAETIFTISKALVAFTTAGILTKSQAAAYLGEKTLLTHVQLTEEQVKAADENMTEAENASKVSSETQLKTAEMADKTTREGQKISAKTAKEGQAAQAKAKAVAKPPAKKVSGGSVNTNVAGQTGKGTGKSN